LAAPVETAKPLFHNRTNGEAVGDNTTANKTANDFQTLPYNSTETSTIKTNMTNRNSSLTPGLTDGSLVQLRRTIFLSSPNSKGVS